MVFTGYDLLPGAEFPRAYRVENSWGTSTGDNGYWVMTDGWFDKHMYQVAVHQDLVSQQVLDVLKQDPHVLPPWDPMGSLAQ